jgi:hypothetical protein
MATNIVPSLFGLTQQQVRQQQLAEDQQFAKEYMSTQATPYARERAYLGATVGSGLVRGIAGLFGLKTGAEQTASAMDEALKVATQSLPPEQRGNRAAVMGKISEVLGANPNFQREAIQAAMQAGEFAKEDLITNADIGYKKALTERQNIEIEQEKKERQGSVAYGAMRSLEKAKDPAAQTKIWENAISALEGQGLDVSVLKEIPFEERSNVLESIVDASTTGKERLATARAANELVFKEREALRKEAKDKATIDYQNKRMDLMLEITRLQQAGADRRSIRQLEILGEKLEQDHKKSQFNFELGSRKAISDSLNRPEGGVRIKKIIEQNYEDIDTATSKALVGPAAAAITGYLNKVDDKGQFIYTEAEAYDKGIADSIKENTEISKGIFGDSRKIKKKTPGQSSGYSEAEQSWIDSAKKLNPDLSETDIIAEGKRKGKLK